MIPQKYTYVFTNITAVNGVPDDDFVMDFTDARKITIQVDAAKDSNHTATDWDLNVIAAPLATGTFDTTPYAEKNFGDDAIQSYPITPGPLFGKLRLDENGALRADVTVIVTVERHN